MQAAWGLLLMLKQSLSSTESSFLNESSPELAGEDYDCRHGCTGIVEG